MKHSREIPDKYVSSCRKEIRKQGTEKEVPEESSTSEPNFALSEELEKYLEKAMEKWDKIDCPQMIPDSGKDSRKYGDNSPSTPGNNFTKKSDLVSIPISKAGNPEIPQDLTKIASTPAAPSLEASSRRQEYISPSPMRVYKKSNESSSLTQTWIEKMAAMDRRSMQTGHQKKPGRRRPRQARSEGVYPPFEEIKKEPKSIFPLPPQENVEISLHSLHMEEIEDTESEPLEASFVARQFGKKMITNKVGQTSKFLPSHIPNVISTFQQLIYKFFQSTFISTQKPSIPDKCIPLDCALAEIMSFTKIFETTIYECKILYSTGPDLTSPVALLTGKSFLVKGDRVRLYSPRKFPSEFLDMDMIIAKRIETIKKGEEFTLSIQIPEKM